jgi:hypothetical protein
MKKLLVLLLSVFAANAAFAQKVELGVVGGGLFSGGSKTTTAVEGSIAFRMIGVPMASLYLELPIAGGLSNSTGATPLLTCTIPCTIVTSYSSLFVGPGVKLKLAGGLPVSPFVTVGAGLAHFNQTRASGTNTSTNSALVQYGGGLDLKIAPFIGLRGEVRDYYTGSADGGSGRQHNVLAGAGIVLRF